MPDGQRILSGGDRRTVRGAPRRHPQEHLRLHTIVSPSWRCPTTSTRSPARSTTVKLFNVNDGAVLRTFTHHEAVRSLALLPDGLRFVSGSTTPPPASPTTASRRTRDLNESDMPYLSSEL